MLFWCFLFCPIFQFLFTCYFSCFRFYSSPAPNLLHSLNWAQKLILWFSNVVIRKWNFLLSLIKKRLWNLERDCEILRSNDTYTWGHIWFSFAIVFSFMSFEVSDLSTLTYTWAWISIAPLPRLVYATSCSLFRN